MTKLEEHIHYLKLTKDTAILQPEIRDAVEFAIKAIEVLEEAKSE